MDPRFDIPRDRKRLSLWRICLLMGLTALIFILLTTRFEEVVLLLGSLALA